MAPEWEKIGQGGYGKVYRLRNAQPGEEIVRKDIVIRASDGDIYQANAECQIMQYLQGGPHIAEYIQSQVNAERETLEIYMRYYSGGSLDDAIDRMLQRNLCFSPAQVVAVGTQIAAALKYSHSANILHRDLKPANVLIGNSWSAHKPGRIPHVYLSDFGLSRVVETINTRITGGVGTRGWVAPEIVIGNDSQFSAKADMYALGLILLTMCTHWATHHGVDIAADSLPDRYSSELRTLINELLKSDRQLRPTAEKAVERLRNMAG
ncbi:kinase-like protein [Stipitochalara longipes BDJ]|nr:kinase-like protein [Stipitochalara longipes BDJ]